MLKAGLWRGVVVLLFAAGSLSATAKDMNIQADVSAGSLKATDLGGASEAAVTADANGKLVRAATLGDALVDDNITVNMAQDSAKLDGQPSSFYAQSSMLNYFLPLGGGTLTGSLTAPSLRATGLTVAGPVKCDANGNLSSIATLPIANGGTGESSAGAACTALGLGTTSSPTFKALSLTNSSDTNILNITSTRVSTVGGYINLNHAYGSNALTSGQYLGSIFFNGYNGSSYATGAVISGIASSSWASSRSSGIEFKTSNNGSLILPMTLKDKGLLELKGVPTGASLTGASLYVNPASATSYYYLMAAGVNGSSKFSVDASGNGTFTGNLSLGTGKTFTLPNGGLSLGTSIVLGTPTFYGTTTFQPSSTVCALKVKTAAWPAAMEVWNTGDSTTANGIKITCGPASPDAANPTVPLAFYQNDQSNTMLGWLQARPGYVGLAWTSDERLKEDIEPTQMDASSIIRNIEIIDYQYKDGVTDDGKLAPVMSESTDSQEPITGFSAQNLMTIYPQAVCAIPVKSSDESSTDTVARATTTEETYYGVSPTALIPVLIKQAQEQQAQIDTLETKVSDQATEISDLKTQLAELRTTVETLASR